MADVIRTYISANRWPAICTCAKCEYVSFLGHSVQQILLLVHIHCVSKKRTATINIGLI